MPLPVSDEAKAAVPDEIRRRARAAAEEGLRERLHAIGMDPRSAAEYEEMRGKVEEPASQLRALIRSLPSGSRERVWKRLQGTGELDESRLVDGLAGDRLVFKRRAREQPMPGVPLPGKRRIRIVVDVSGSMYRFNGEDGRLQRLLEAICMVMEALDGSGGPSGGRSSSSGLAWSITGHSGDSDRIDFV